MSNLSNILEQIILLVYNNYLISNKLKLNMIRKEGFSLLDCFDLLNLNNNGKINYFCIREYLKGNNFYCTEIESHLLITLSNNKDHWSCFDFKNYLQSDNQMKHESLRVSVNNNNLKNSIVSLFYFSFENDLLEILSNDIQYIRRLNKLWIKLSKQDDYFECFNLLSNNNFITIDSMINFINNSYYDSLSYQKAAIFLKSISSNSNKISYSDFDKFSDSILFKSSKFQLTTKNCYIKDYIANSPSKDKYHNDFVNLLKFLIINERKQMNIRKSFNNNELNVEEIYLFFLNKNKYHDYINKYDIFTGLTKLNVHIDSLYEVELIIKKYDTSKKGILYYRDFCHLISPIQDESNNMKINNIDLDYDRYINYSYFSYFLIPPKTSEYLNNLIVSIIDSERLTRSICIRFSEEEDFDFDYYFKKISYNNKATSSSIRDFLMIHGINVYEEEVSNVIYSIIKGNRKYISKSDFINYLIN